MYFLGYDVFLEVNLGEFVQPGNAYMVELLVLVLDFKSQGSGREMSIIS